MTRLHRLIVNVRLTLSSLCLRRSSQAVLIVCLGMCGTAGPAQKPSFTDVAAASIDDGLCFGDIDADGDLDLVGYTSISGPRRFAVYRNDLPARHWLRVRLIGARGNRGAAGAKIRVFTPGGGRLLWYEQVAIYDSQAAASYYALPVTERHFGLGRRQTVDVSVEFYPSRVLVWKCGVNANETVEIPEPSATEQRGDVPAEFKGSEPSPPLPVTLLVFVLREA